MQIFIENKNMTERQYHLHFMCGVYGVEMLLFSLNQLDFKYLSIYVICFLKNGKLLIG